MKLVKDPKWNAFTAVYAADRSQQQWAFRKEGNHWMLRDGEGYVRTMEKTWRGSLPRINLCLENHGMETRLS